MNIGVVGLWHLGCVLSASWFKLGAKVIGIDFDPQLVDNLSKGKAPIFEPGLSELLEKKQIAFSTDPSLLKKCDFVFLAYDTPVNESDEYDLSPLEQALDRIVPHLKDHSLLIVSSQLPVGTSQQFRHKLKSYNSSLELVYSPENLRLGEAIDNYLNPGHIVIGANSALTLQAASQLFSHIPATQLPMDLPSAEMAKHAINSFLATSVTFANQLSDACALSGADFNQVTAVMKQDPRIGKKAYLKAGIGFSGGTLGRDLKILDSIHQGAGKQTLPLFGQVWHYNQLRPELIVQRVTQALGTLQNQVIGLLGITYKPGTSTLRRSLPLEIAHRLKARGARLRVYDPKANWREANLNGIEICDSPQTLADSAHLLLLLTEWPEFKLLNYNTLMNKMKTKILLDPHGFLDGLKK